MSQKVRNSDFEKIFQAFIKRYGQAEGEKNYQTWLSKMGLDETKPYARPQESFKWAKNLFSYLREDEKKKYFKVEASFPLSSMNNNVYTRDELLRGARSLVGKPCNLNHEGAKLDSVSVDGAEFEDDAVECILGFMKGSDVLGMVEKGDIVHVSTEADCLQGTEQTTDGIVCLGLVYTGLALLTKDVLPGVPLTRIMPVESIVESFQVMLNGGEKLVENDKGKTEESKVVDAGIVEGSPNVLVAAPAGPEPPTPQPKTEEKKSPCEEAKEALLVRVSVLEGKVQVIETDIAIEDAVRRKALKDIEEKAAAEKKLQESVVQKLRPAVLTEKGFWARFHELRGEGHGKSDAFRLLSLEVFEASRSKA